MTEQRAETMPRARKKRARVVKTNRGLGQRHAAVLAKVGAVALDMEEPLNQAIWFVRVLEQVSGDDKETAAIAFVATEARLRLDALHEFWRKLLASARLPGGGTK